MKRCTHTEIILIALTLAFLALAVWAYGSGRGEGVSVERGGLVETVPRPTVSPSPSPLLPVDINKADAAELALLPGVGETLAGRIVEYRDENGPFAAAEDIMRVSGIGESTFAKLRDLITTGETP